MITSKWDHSCSIVPVWVCLLDNLGIYFLRGVVIIIIFLCPNDDIYTGHMIHFLINKYAYLVVEVIVVKEEEENEK